MQDYVDKLVDLWSTERPDLDFSPWGVTVRITRLAAYLHTAEEQTFKAVDLNRGCVEVLTLLRRVGPPYRRSPTNLFKSLLISPGTATGRLDKLERAGLVKRTGAASDKRALFAELTPVGKTVVDEVVESLLPTRQEQLRSLTDSEQEQLAGLLRKLLLSIEQQGGVAGPEALQAS